MSWVPPVPQTMPAAGAMPSTALAVAPMQSYGAAQILSVDSVVETGGVKVLVYGKASAGKTRLILTAPRPIVISTENGLLSIKGHNLPMFPPVHSIEDLERIHGWIKTDPRLQHFDTICIDGLSEICETVLYAEQRSTNDGRKAYGEMATNILHKVMRPFRDLADKNVYFTAKETNDKDGSGMMLFMPSAPGKQIQGEIPYFFDEVFRLEVHTDMATNATTSWLRCRPNNVSTAKDRSGKLSEFEEPHLGKLFAKIAG